MVLPWQNLVIATQQLGFNFLVIWVLGNVVGRYEKEKGTRKVIGNLFLPKIHFKMLSKDPVFRYEWQLDSLSKKKVITRMERK